MNINEGRSFFDNILLNLFIKKKKKGEDHCIRSLIGKELLVF